MPDLYGKFENGGYYFEAWMPSGDLDPLEWTVKVFGGLNDVLLKQRTIPMYHIPLFGVDIEDQQALEDEVDKLLIELGLSTTE